MDFGFSSGSSSNLSSTSKSGFPILSHPDAAILDEILASAKPNSTIFSALIEPYQATLARHHLDPRLDERFYSLLLKLSLVPGADWSQKWDRVCAEQGLFEDEDSLDRLSSQLRSNSSHHSESAQEDGTPTVVALPHRPAYRPLPPSPPVFLSTFPRRGPIQSTPNRTVHFDPPIHLPVSRLAPSLLANPRPSPYKLPDTRPSPTLALNACLPTAAKTANSRLSPALLSSPRPSPSKLVDPLDALSDRFRTDCLRRRFLHAWIHCYQRLSLTITEVSKARVVLVSGNMWRRWRSKVGKRKREVRMVEGVARHRLKSALLMRWREAAQESRHRRWKAHLSQLAAAYLHQYHQAQLIEAIAMWWLKARARRAEQQQTRLAKHSVLTHWLGRLSKLRRAAQLAEVFLTDVKRVAELRWLMGRWRERMGWRIGLRTMVERREARMVADLLRRWGRLALLDRLARQTSQRLTSRRWISAWRRHLSRLHRLEKRANRIIVIRNENLMSKILNSWVILERGALLRRVLCSRLSKVSLEAWMRRLQHVRLKLQGARQVLEKSFQRRDQARIFRHWHQRFTHHQNRLRPLATKADESRLRKLALNRWRARASHGTQKQSQADLARDMLLRERMLGLWMRRFRRSRILNWVKERKTKTIRKTFEEWINRLRRQKSDNFLIADFALKLDRHRISHSITLWVSRVVQLRSRQMEVRREYETDLERFHFEKWLRCIREIYRFEQLASGFAQIQSIERRDRMLEFWRARAVGSRRRKVCLEEWVKRSRMMLIRNCWGRWIDIYVQRDLAGQEEAVRRRSVIETRHRFMRAWQQRTEIIPAIHFYREKARAKTWSHWNILVPVRRMRLVAEQVDGKKIVGEAWRVWWRKCTAILASRIASRFRRPVAFGGARKWVGNGMSPKFGSLTRKEPNQGLLSSSSSSDGCSSIRSRNASPAPAVVRQEEIEEDEDDRTITGDTAMPDPDVEQGVVSEEESESVEEVSTEDTDEGATENEIELAFGNRAARRRVGGGTEPNEGRNALWNGLRRGNNGARRN